MKFYKIEIRSFRSLTNLKFPISNEDLNIFCGANNVGKTNVLKAIYLFFKADINEFDDKNDIPYHISEGARGNAYRVEMVGHFIDKSYEYQITVKLTPKNRNSDQILSVSGKKHPLGKSKSFEHISEEECLNILRSFRVIFIGANNIDLPNLISEIFISEVLTDLDKLRSRQINSLADLKKFQESSTTAMQSIEVGLTKQIQSFSNIDDLSIGKWKAKIKFPEFSKLRDAISKLVDFTILDTNDLTLDFKGSGAQKIVLLAIMRYMAQNDNNTIWLLDEPEAFLQPALQKRVFRELKGLSNSINIIITTHSQYFVDQANLTTTHLLISEQKEKEYSRKRGRSFIQNSAKIDVSLGSEKVGKIKRHLGIENNDSWTISTTNIITEGDDDKQYITKMLSKLDMPIPNILVSSGTDKLKGFLSFLEEFTEGMEFSPKFICILDNDEAGKSVAKSLLGKSEKRSIDVESIFVHRTKDEGDAKLDFEFEDMIPHELLLNAVNKILQKKSYKKLRRGALSNRYSRAYNESCVLQYLTILVTKANEEQSPINFEAMGMKVFLNSTIVSLIDEMTQEEFKKLVDDNPGLSSFLTKVSKYAEN